MGEGQTRQKVSQKYFLLNFQSIRCHKNINMLKIVIFSIIVSIVTAKEADEKYDFKFKKNQF